MKQLSLFAMNKKNTETYITETVDALYEMAKDMYNSKFVIVRVDTPDVPEEALGEIAEVLDFSFPDGATEPMFVLSGIATTVPMSCLAVA